MLSALIPSAGRQPAVPLAGQLAHESCVRPGPLVLGTALLKSPTPTEDRDRHSCYRRLHTLQLGGQVISAWLCMSPCRSDYIFTNAFAVSSQNQRNGVRHIVSEDSGLPLMTSLQRTLLCRPPPFIDNASSRRRTNPQDVRW